MALQTKSIKQKIKSVKNIGKITKTMEMVSVSKMKKVTTRATSGRPYSRYALQLLHHIASEDHITHPLLEKTDGSKILIIIMSSNKGLAGSYNSNITKALALFKSKRGKSNDQIECVAVGRQAEKSARVNGLHVKKVFSDFTDKSTSEDFLIIRDLILREFETEEYEAINILFTEFKSATSYKPFMMRLLPIEEHIYKDLLTHNTNENGLVSESELSMYTFEPNEAEILNKIIHELLEQAIFHTFLESLASEHSSRMFAMKNANDNAENILDELTLYYNQVRQSAITQELSEIVGGATAMN